MIDTLESLETPVHSPEKKIVLKAISDSPGKITVADIATKTSLPVLQANGLLNQIAYETGGHLTVGTAGSIVYEFDRNFQNEYLSRSSKNFFKRMGRVVYNGAAYAIRIFSLVMFLVIRVSFGIALIASVVLIVALVALAVIALLAKLMGNDNDSGPDIDFSGIFGGIGGIFRYWAWDWMWDWWYWGSYIRWDPTPTRYYEPITDKKGKTQSGEKKESFLDKCFSFLFGDGDPNQGLEQRYWQTIALALKANNGVVAAEQLTPYALVEGKNEDWMLPIMVRFNGNCDVTESGNIIYNFPSFQQHLDTKTDNTSATPAPDDLAAMFQSYVKLKKSNQERQVQVSRLDPYLKEQPWVLSHVTGGSRFTIICFAIFILVGGIWLSTLSGLLPIIAMLKPLLYAMSAYGAMFLLIPGIRSLIINHRNAEIEKRNSIRYTALNKLQSPDPDLKKKLKEADSTRKLAVLESSKEGIVYSTERDALEQEFENKQIPES